MPIYGLYYSTMVHLFTGIYVRKLSNNIKYGTGLSNLQKRLEIQKIGNLSYEIRDDKMQFIIQLNKKD